MFWLYFVPNLLVFHQLDTLYLGGNNVRVMCEKSEEFNCVSIQEVSRDWISRVTCNW